MKQIRHGLFQSPVSLLSRSRHIASPELELSFYRDHSAMVAKEESGDSAILCLNPLGRFAFGSVLLEKIE